MKIIIKEKDMYMLCLVIMFVLLIAALMFCYEVRNIAEEYLIKYNECINKSSMPFLIR